MHDPLAPLLADGVIDAVLSRLKSGKEADLWVVEHRGEVLAAKVYKARQDRSFKNNAAYREGRQVRNTRTQRAMDRGTSFGRAAAEEAWKAKEADALHALHAAGVRVPKPVIFYEGVLVMELVVDPAGHPAPRLVDAAIPPGQAAALYADLRAQAIRMLICDLVHGDLSPYNVLLAWNGPTVIDFPQVVGAAHNRQAERFFERDLESLRRFFLAHDPALQASSGDAREIWRAYERRELGPDFVPSGRPPPAEKAKPPRREPREPGAAPAPPHQPAHQRGQGRREEPGRGALPGAGGGRPQGQRERNRPDERPRGEERPRREDRPRQGGPQRTVVVERLGPRAPAAPHATGHGGSHGASLRGQPAPAHGGGQGGPHGGQARAAPGGAAGPGHGASHGRGYSPQAVPVNRGGQHAEKQGGANRAVQGQGKGHAGGAASGGSADAGGGGGRKRRRRRGR